MMKKFFGTDGIRGRVGNKPISPDWFLKLGWAVGKIVSAKQRGKVLIGKDTRISGYMFESALEAGLVASGTDVCLLGPMPTPGIAYLTRTLQANAGIVISASHNAFYDNGIKFFSPEGCKLSDDLEILIEQKLEQPIQTVDSSNLGKAQRINDAQGRYIEFCKSTFPSYLNLKGITIVVDCAHGATYSVAPSVFQELGATVIPIGNTPNGLNINDGCGSTHPKVIAKQVTASGADLGIALDGDGDRVILVDNAGKVVDGDEILLILTQWYLQQGVKFGGVAGTLMSNLGLEQALDKLKVPFFRTKVGDRYIISALQARGWLLGGEPSGHIVCLDAHTTGDGIISALRVLAAMVSFNKSLVELNQRMEKYPQILVNVPFDVNTDLTANLNKPAIKSAVATAETDLKGQGRVLLRASGTEPMVRVMVEGKDKKLIKNAATSLAEKISVVLQPA